MIDWNQVTGIQTDGFCISHYDWSSAFAYADGFIQQDVEKVIIAWGRSPEGYGSIEMHGLFRLKDNRYACLNAWADTTGWGCQESGDSSLHPTFDHAVRFGMTDEIRRIYGYDQPDDIDPRSIIKELDEIDDALFQVEVEWHGTQ